MKFNLIIIVFALLSILIGCKEHTTTCLSPDIDKMARDFANPPDSVKPWAYWFWIFNLVDKEGITRDLQQFRAKGIGGAILICTGGYGGKERQENGPDLLSPGWRELFQHALKEADRLNIKIGFNIAGGWVMFGPWVTKDNAMKHIVQSKLILTGPREFSDTLPMPRIVDGYYQDYKVQAFLVEDTKSDNLKNQFEHKKFIKSSNIIDITDKLSPEGYLKWNVPKGRWHILRTGYTLTGRKFTATDDISPGSEGYEIDFLNPKALDVHFLHIGNEVIKEAGSLVGKTLTFLWADSYEAGNLTWTKDLPNMFRKYRGYDLIQYLPTFSNYIVDDNDITARFKSDFERTVMDCMADNFWGRFAELCHQNGLEMGSEASSLFPGPPPMDNLKNLGKCDIPSGEFWADLCYGYKYPNRLDGYNFNCKQTSSAAHIYGKKKALAEAFTSQGSDSTVHWTIGPTDLKPIGDIAFCEGINHFMLHEVTCLRPSDGVPGLELCAGTHFSPNITWWNQSEPFFSYISRCQYLLQQGLFVADVLIYLGENPPVTAPPKQIIPSLGLGYDLDYCNTEGLLTRLKVEKGTLILPDGMKYRLLVLPNSETMSPEVVKKIYELVKAGAVVIGPKPTHSNSLSGYPSCDHEVKQVAEKLWGNYDGQKIKERSVGKGKVIWDKTIREVLLQEGIHPDFEYKSAEPDTSIDFIHRSTGETEIYFLANKRKRCSNIECSFRVAGKQPEFWDPVTGNIREALSFSQLNGRTTLPFKLPPYGSIFVVFHKKIPTDSVGSAKQNSPESAGSQEIPGPWTVKFDPKWGGPKSVQFNDLISWTRRKEEGIKYYSGTATYEKKFDLPSWMSVHDSKLVLDLGEVKELVTVRLNGQNLGILWTAPWQVDINSAIKSRDNLLELEVVNLWANRVIWDLSLPVEKRLTKTHKEFRLNFLSKNTRLRESGLLGPVTISLEKKN